jgi:hypothetical protein
MKGWKLNVMYCRQKYEQSPVTVQCGRPQLLLAFSKFATCGDQMAAIIALHLTYRLLQVELHGVQVLDQALKLSTDDVYKVLDAYLNCMNVHSKIKLLRLLTVRILTKLLSSSVSEIKTLMRQARQARENSKDLLARLL